MSNVPKPGDHIMTFGLYRGQTVQAVGSDAPGRQYLRWMVGEGKVFDRVLRAAIVDFLKIHEENTEAI